jgi:hypothetical protein
VPCSLTSVVQRSLGNGNPRDGSRIHQSLRGRGLLRGMRSLSRSLESRHVRGIATVAKARISSGADPTFPQRFAFMVKTQTEI